MIDTHSHILPAMDDGIPDPLQTFNVIKTAESQGVRAIFCTPHSYDGFFDCTKENILKKWDELSRLLKEMGAGIKVLPGAEVRLRHDLIAEIDKGNVLTLNNSGRFLLLELPDLFMPHSVCKVLRQLKARGITPVIAHGERNPILVRKNEVLEDFIRRGAVVQVTASSLMGDFGKMALKAAQLMVLKGQVFCIGSDFHPGRRYRMADARDRLCKLAGKEEANRITLENPFTMIEQAEEKKKSVLLRK